MSELMHLCACHLSAPADKLAETKRAEREVKEIYRCAQQLLQPQPGYRAYPEPALPDGVPRCPLPGCRAERVQQKEEK